MEKETVYVGGGVGERVRGTTLNCGFVGWCVGQVDLEAPFFPHVIVKSGYNLLTSSDVAIDDRCNHVLWLIKKISLKVNIFI